MKKLIAAATILAFSSSVAFAHETAENAPRKTDETAKVQVPNKAEKKPVAHSGGTDSNGCHTNHQTGDYHCHNRK